MSEGAKQKKIAALSFEKALARLEEIVNQLEQGQAGLEDSITLYEEGMILKTHCERKLEQARMRVEKVSLNAGKAAGLEPADDIESENS